MGLTARRSGFPIERIIGSPAHPDRLIHPPHSRGRWIPIDEQPQYTEVLGGAVGGLKREDVPRVVSNLLQECRDREVELTIRPEVIGGYYTVEWQYVELDQDGMGWEPLADLSEEESRE